MQKAEKFWGRDALLCQMQFLPFGREPASSSLTRERLGPLRKALDRASVDYSPANPLAALAGLVPTSAPSRVRAARPQPFESPMPRAARIAFHTHLFHPRPADRVSPCESQFQPDLLVLHLNAALELTLGTASSASALVVITSVTDAPLADHHRDLLWRSLGLPVFEQLTGWDGTVIGRECEAHDGLHVAAEAAIAEVDNGELLLTQFSVEESVLRARTGIAAQLSMSLCECGRDTPRLKKVTALAVRAMRAHAA